MTRDFVLDWIEQTMDGLACDIAPIEHVPVGAGNRFGELAPLLMAASVFDGAFAIDVLARMLDLDPRRLAAPMAAAVEGGHFERAGDGRSQWHTFRDPAAAREIYAAIAEDGKPQLHRRAAEALRASVATPSLALAASIARHFEIAAEWSNALLWRRVAAERAIELEMPAVAVEHLRTAQAICDSEGVHPSPRIELAVLDMMGPLLAQLEGSGSRHVATIYTRCLEIAGGFDDTETAVEFDMLWGLNACVLVHGRVETGRELSRKLVQAAEAANDCARLLLARRLDALGMMLAGEIEAAIVGFEAVCRLYETTRHADLRYRYASDQAAVALAHKSWAEAIAGATAASDRSSADAIDHAERLRHAHTSAHVMCILAARAQTLQRRDQAGSLATAGLLLARRHSFPYWCAWADIVLGWHEAGRDARKGIARVDSGIAAYRLTGGGQALPYAMLLRASLALIAGDRMAALDAAEAGLELAAAHGVRLFEAELLRIKALASGRDHGRQAMLNEALAIARRQGAGLFAEQIEAHLVGRID